MVMKYFIVKKQRKSSQGDFSATKYFIVKKHYRRWKTNFVTRWKFSTTLVKFFFFVTHIICDKKNNNLWQFSFISKDWETPSMSILCLLLHISFVYLSFPIVFLFPLCSPLGSFGRLKKIYIFSQNISA